MTPAERLAAGLKRMPNGCLEWTRSTNARGYGQITVRAMKVGPFLTHRFAWMLANGPIPPCVHVLHHCDNPPCCQTEPTDGYPDGHLFLGTQADNMADMGAKGRHGHRGPSRKALSDPAGSMELAKTDPPKEDSP